MEFQLIITRPRESEILIIKEFADVSFLSMHEKRHAGMYGHLHVRVIF